MPHLYRKITGDYIDFDVPLALSGKLNKRLNDMATVANDVVSLNNFFEPEPEPEQKQNTTLEQASQITFDASKTIFKSIHNAKKFNKCVEIEMEYFGFINNLTIANEWKDKMNNKNINLGVCPYFHTKKKINDIKVHNKCMYKRTSLIDPVLAHKMKNKMNCVKSNCKCSFYLYSVPMMGMEYKMVNCRTVGYGGASNEYFAKKILYYTNEYHNKYFYNYCDSHNENIYNIDVFYEFRYEIGFSKRNMYNRYNEFEECCKYNVAKCFNIRRMQNAVIVRAYSHYGAKDIIGEYIKTISNKYTHIEITPPLNDIILSESESNELLKHMYCHCDNCNDKNVHNYVFAHDRGEYYADITIDYIDYHNMGNNIDTIPNYFL